MAEKIIEYGIAAGEHHKQLVQVVDEQIRAGWQPFNNVFEYMYGDQKLLCQPMVKYEVKKKSSNQS